MAKGLKYRRILLKVSGEALAGDEPSGIDPKFLDRVAVQIIELANKGVEIGVVIGGGNIFRGMSVAAKGVDRVTGDHMGMLSTVINAIALADAIRRNGGNSHVFSSVTMPSIADSFTQRAAISAIKSGSIVICAGGTGNPFFTTDTAAALKAIELRCDALLKGTNVDGVYSADPKIDNNAKRYSKISYEDVINNNLRIMDTAAFALARDNKLPIIIYSLAAEGGLIGVLEGSAKSTYVGQ